MTNPHAVFTRLAGGFLLGSIAFAGCAPATAEEGPKLDEPSIETEVVYADSDDSATRPTRLGALASGETGNGTFERNQRFLSWTFEGALGDTAVINASDAIRFIRADPGYRELDTVASLYRATASGNPTGRALAVNDDFDGRLASHIEFALPRAGSYVIVVRRYDYGNTGSVNVALELRRPTLGLACGTRGALISCSDGEYCARGPGAMCGRAMPQASARLARVPVSSSTIPSAAATAKPTAARATQPPRASRSTTPASAADRREDYHNIKIID